jgi:hypothetical protein
MFGKKEKRPGKPERPLRHAPELCAGHPPNDHQQNAAERHHREGRRFRHDRYRSINNKVITT